MIMKQFGLYLIKHSASVLALYFLGWYTAMLQGAFAIYALVLINRHIDYAGIQWLWGSLAFVGGFLVMEACTIRTTGDGYYESVIVPFDGIDVEITI